MVYILSEGSLGHVGEDSSVCIQKQGDGKFYLVHNSTFKEIRDLEGTCNWCV